MTDAATIGARELDAKLATAFGWESVDYYHPRYELAGVAPGTHNIQVIPHYSTTYEGMGLVIERMKAHGFRDVNIEQRNGVVWFVEWCRPSEEFVARDASLPRAVALAALSALEQHP